MIPPRPSHHLRPAPKERENQSPAHESFLFLLRGDPGRGDAPTLTLCGGSASKRETPTFSQVPWGTLGRSSFILFFFLSFFYFIFFVALAEITGTPDVDAQKKKRMKKKTRKKTQRHRGKRKIPFNFLSPPRSPLAPTATPRRKDPQFVNDGKHPLKSRFA